jgi:hypothetical protein
MNMEVPIALKLDHDELRSGLEKASKERGPVGEAARELAGLALPHMAREEKIAFPALGLLAELATGDVRAEMAAALPLIADFISGQSAFRTDHQQISYRFQVLLEAAKKEGNDRYAQLAYKGMVHERIEEAVIYPTIILIGKYIRQQLKR